MFYHTTQIRAIFYVRRNVAASTTELLDERLRKEKVEFVLTPEGGTDLGVNVKLCPKILQLSALLRVDTPKKNLPVLFCSVVSTLTLLKLSLLGKDRLQNSPDPARKFVLIAYHVKNGSGTR